MGGSVDQANLLLKLIQWISRKNPTLLVLHLMTTHSLLEVWGRGKTQMI